MSLLSFYISSLNTHGLNCQNKIMFLRDFLDASRIDVCFLQETHVSDPKIKQLIENTLYNYQVFMPLTSSTSRGVGILIRNNCSIEVLDQFFDFENRMIGLECRISDVFFCFVNIYAPNNVNEQLSFIENMCEILNRRKNLIFGGDFNAIVDENDRMTENVQTKSLRRSDKAWSDFYNLFQFSEFTSNLSFSNRMTWTNGHQSSRIDRIYFHNNLNLEAKYVENIFFPMSDHRMIKAKVLVRDKRVSKLKRDCLWKLNESILDEEYIESGVKDLVNEIPTLKVRFKCKWYDTFISSVCEFLKSETKRINNMKRERKATLFEKISMLDGMDFECQEKMRIKNDMICEIKEIYNEERIGNEKRVCDERLNFVKQPTKVLIQEELKKSKQSLIKRYECANGVKTEDTKTILSDVSSFYDDLLGKERVNVERIENYEFKIKPLSEDFSWMGLDNRISYNEVYDCIKIMNDAAPGKNGLSIGFYKKFFPLFGEHFIEILNSEDELPDAFKETIIKLIPKNEKEFKTVNDLRPISLTNYEYRIFTKVLANRLRKVSGNIISPGQTCSIVGRKINDSVCLVRDLISDANLKGKELFLVSVDQSKAFDRVSLAYLFKLLEHMNLGKFLVNSIKRVYDGSFAQGMINSNLSDKILTKSGLKQGCALSMLLYVLCIEELIERIKSNNNIKGYKVNVLKSFLVKVSAYADDMCGVLSSFESISELFLEMNEWSKISGAKINADKTKILAINSRYQRFEGIEFDNELKLLGIIYNIRGLSKANLKSVKEKLEKGLLIWKGANLNILERIIVCKTFLLNKLYYVANFMKLDEKYVCEIEKMLYTFIWNGAIEMISRRTLILPYESGGLAMMSVRARIETILFNQFQNIVLNKHKLEYQLGIYWLKFSLKDYHLENFNIIPGGLEKDRPDIYAEIIKAANRVNETFPDKKKALKLESKAIYQSLLVKYEKAPKLQTLNPSLDWKEVFKLNQFVCRDSNIRSFNYKFLYDAIPCNQRFNNREKIKCYFCNNKTESTSHVFVECELTKDLFKSMESQFETKNLVLSVKKLCLAETLPKNDYILLSLFKIVIWQLRNYARTHKNTSLSKTIFENYFKKWKRKIGFSEIFSLP